MDSAEYKHIRVLIVEDEEIQRKLLYFLLIKKVAEVYVAKDGIDGIEQFKTHKPNLIITDVMMPKLNGLEMLKEIKRFDPNITSFLVSATDDSYLFEDALNIGINKFLSRPIKKDLLDTYLKKFNKTIEMKNRVNSEHRLLEQYKDIIDASMLVTKTDPNGIILYANKKFCKVSGYKESELLGQPHNLVRHHEMESQVFKSMWESIKGKKTWRGTIKNAKKNGDFYVVNATVFPILDEDKNIVEYISIREDITDIYITKEKEKIEKEKEHLEKLSKTKESFLVVFTHELKTPLNAIMSFSQYVLKKVRKSDIKDKDELVELLGEVKQNADDMLDNITNIIDISRLKSDRLKFNLSTFSLEDLIQDLNSQFVSLTVKSGIDVMFEMECQTTLYYDRSRIKQIASNLFSNAIKYGEDKILIKVISNENKFTISIEDNGPGVSNPDKVFGLFEQDEEDDFKRTAKGTGVGLHFTKMLCNNFGFEIDISRSQTLGGACFKISGNCKYIGENGV